MISSKEQVNQALGIQRVANHLLILRLADLGDEDNSVSLANGKRRQQKCYTMGIPLFWGREHTMS